MSTKSELAISVGGSTNRLYISIYWQYAIGCLTLLGLTYCVFIKGICQYIFNRRFSQD